MNEEIQVIQWIFAIFYEVWRASSQKCFEGKDAPDAMTFHHNAIRSVWSFDNAADVLHKISFAPISVPNCNVQWSAPVSGSFKLNADAAGLYDEGRWGLAAMV